MGNDLIDFIQAFLFLRLIQVWGNWYPQTFNDARMMFIYDFWNYLSVWINHCPSYRKHNGMDFWRLYAVGGRDGSSCLRSVECFDPHTNRWTIVAPMTKRRGGVGVAVAHGYLYAFGGHDAPASNPSAARFDCVER